jgi:hypothetical protein
MNLTDYRTLAAKSMTEGELQRAVIDLADLYGWRWYHVHDSRRSNPGFPDLVLVRRGRCLFLELKREGKGPTRAQRDWLDDLGELEKTTGRVRKGGSATPQPVAGRDYRGGVAWMTLLPLKPP